jgi:hypothetical protein
MRIKNLLTSGIVIVLLASLAIVGGACSKKPYTVNVIPQPTLSSIAITPVSVPELELGSTQRFTAQGTYSDSTVKDMTAEVVWHSLNNLVATISSDAVARTLSNGTTDITATWYDFTSNVVTLVVKKPVLLSIEIKPAKLENLLVGETTGLAATGTYSDGSTRDITYNVAWTSSNKDVADIAQTGIIGGVSAGTVNITASLSGVTSPPVELTVVSP